MRKASKLELTEAFTASSSFGRIAVILCSRKRMIWLAALLVTLMLPFRAPAVDGVIEINQACATGAGCLPGDSPGLPVEIGDAGSFVLTGELVVDKDTTAIRVSGFLDLVTIDLNGFTIRGPGSCAGSAPTCNLPGRGIGIDANGHNGSLVVRNGAIRGVGSHAIFADSSSGRAVIESMRIFANAGSGIVVGSNSIVRDNTLGANGGSAIVSGEICSIRGNIINTHGGDGISAGSYCTVIENSVRNAAGTELLMPISSAGYANNVVLGTVSGGSEIGVNICNGSTTCP